MPNFILVQSYKHFKLQLILKKQQSTAKFFTKDSKARQKQLYLMHIQGLAQWLTRHISYYSSKTEKAMNMVFQYVIVTPFLMAISYHTSYKSMLFKSYVPKP